MAAQRSVEQREDVPVLPLRGTCNRHQVLKIDCALVCRKRALRIPTQDQRGISRRGRTRNRTALPLHRSRPRDASGDPRLREMGRRAVRLYAPPANMEKTESRVPQGHISRLPFTAAGEEGIQGSSTVRAPAQAGDAGSSPAPVAKPDLTTMVLDIVTVQLNELEGRRQRAAA